MKQINNKDALNKLLQAGPEFLIEADDLNYMIKSEKSVTCYEDSDCIVYIGNMGQENDTDFVNVVPFNESFDIPIFMQLISENCSNPSLMINVQKLSDVFIDKLDSLLNENFEYQKTYMSYMYSENASISKVSHNIRLLDVSDMDLFTSLPAETAKYRPPLHVLFDIFVVKKQGHILGAFDKDKLVGYLAFITTLPNVFDVDYIYVDPSMRGRGFGKMLGQFYAAYACENKHVALWSNAQNDASKNTAISCGFRLIRQAKKYTKKP